MSGLIEVRHILKDIDGIKFIYFDERDVVRHKLVQEIVKAYDRHQNGGPGHGATRQSPRRGSAGHHPKSAGPRERQDDSGDEGSRSP